jgi:hypothetical protein
MQGNKMIFQKKTLEVIDNDRYVFSCSKQCKAYLTEYRKKKV